jgi:hypothetical protein
LHIRQTAELAGPVLALHISDFFSSVETNLTVGAVAEWFGIGLATTTKRDRVFVERIFVAHGIKQFGGALYYERTVQCCAN